MLATVALTISSGCGGRALAASLSNRAGGSGRPAALQSDQPSAPVPDADAGSHSAAARSRMLECGHQWSSMKKAGTATGTWKDFSRICLAQR